MISVAEIDKAILELEAHDTTYATVERLAWLYVVREHLTGQGTKMDGDSELAELCAGRNARAVWNVLSELVDTVKVLQPRVYGSFVEKIRSIEKD